MHSTQRGLLAINALLLLAAVPAADADSVGEFLVFLQDDGEHYLIQRALRSDAREHRLHVDKSLSLDRLGYIDPDAFRWDDSGADGNVLIFAQGDFTVMYPGRFDAAELAREDDGTFAFSSWDGRVRDDGHFGLWHEPGGFTRFNYAWILPAHFEVIDYASNRDGKWVERGNTLTFFASDVNDLTFTIRYRERDGDGDGVPDRSDQCPDTAHDQPVNGQGCDPDSDGDGVYDRDDQCAGTARGLAVDAIGCEPDRDHDGVPDARDLCGRSPTGSAVDASGCTVDSDSDSIGDYDDRCPGTPTGLFVDRSGCEPDPDGDGVPLSVDRCPDTQAGQAVGTDGCEVDSDGDGVIDREDRCPQSAEGAAVDRGGAHPDEGGTELVALGGAHSLAVLPMAEGAAHQEQLAALGDLLVGADRLLRRGRREQGVEATGQQQAEQQHHQAGQLAPAMPGEPSGGQVQESHECPLGSSKPRGLLLVMSLGRGATVAYLST